MVSHLIGAPPVAELPEAFQLARDSLDRHVVRAATVLGQIDSVLTGASWRTASANELAVSINARNGRIELSFAPGDTLAVMTVGGATRQIRLRRAACR